jgi:hypothetical protein
MTEEEKAIDLINKFQGKEYALLVVEEVMETIDTFDGGTRKYWYGVKKEIVNYKNKL